MRKLSPLGAIRKKCLDCSETIVDVKSCKFDEKATDPCPLWKYRMKKGGGSTLKAIRKYCLWCMNDQPTEVDLCPSNTCVLFPFRYGKNPGRAGIGRKGGNPFLNTNSRHLNEPKRAS